MSTTIQYAIGLVIMYLIMFLFEMKGTPTTIEREDGTEYQQQRTKRQKQYHASARLVFGAWIGIIIALIYMALTK